MKSLKYKSSAILLMGALLVGCQHESTETEMDENESAQQSHTVDTISSASIDGLSSHYHTGDTVSLSVTDKSTNDVDGEWQWFYKDGMDDWTLIENENAHELTTEAVADREIKATYMDASQNIISESEPVTITVDDHDDDVYNGYFDDADIADRSITDWVGEWQSVYPYFKDGEFDEVFEARAEKNEDMTFQDYKEYYDHGYQTDVEQIDIDESGKFTFHKSDDSYSGTYVYDGYEVLEYEAGNRGVRYLFSLESGDDEAPAFIQFSDHNIAPVKSGHFHLYWGDDRDALLEEVEHWPTYYPEGMSVDEIVEDMMRH